MILFSKYLNSRIICNISNRDSFRTMKSITKLAYFNYGRTFGNYYRHGDFGGSK